MLLPLLVLIVLIACETEKIKLLINLKANFVEIVDSEEYAITRIEVSNNSGKEIYFLELEKGLIGKNKISIKGPQEGYRTYGQWTADMFSDSLFLVVYAQKEKTIVEKSFTINLSRLNSIDSLIVIQDKSPFP